MPTSESPLPRPRRPAHWSRAREALREADPVLGGIIANVGRGALLHRGDPFASLARAIVGQQLSTTAAKTIWSRVETAAEGISADRLAGTDWKVLRACGLSDRKTDYLHALARQFAEGRIDPLAWRRMDDESVIEDLTRLPGIGRWTAEMFLIFHLMRPDVLPLGDVGLQRALKLHYGGGEPLGPRKLVRVTEAWRPWRSVATWYLWRSLD